MSIYHKKDCSKQLCDVSRKLLKIPESGYNTTGCNVFGHIRSFDKIITLTGHTYIVWNIIELKNGQLASYISDNTIKVWDLNGTCLQTFTKHTNCVIGIIGF